jgi:hypothetical protein
MIQENAKSWSEIFKNYCQVAAIIIAGWWTYHLFIQKDAPGLEARGNVTSEISWYQTAGSDDWEVNFSVSLENKGTTSFNISKIRVRGWEFDYGSAKKHLDFIDPNKIQSGATFSDTTYTSKAKSGLPFPSHFPPGAAAGNSFVWLLKDPDCKKRIYFLAEFYKDGEESPNWSTYQWGQECSHEESDDKAK